MVLYFLFRLYGWFFFFFYVVGNELDDFFMNVVGNEQVNVMASKCKDH